MTGKKEKNGFFWSRWSCFLLSRKIPITHIVYMLLYTEALFRFNNIERKGGQSFGWVKVEKLLLGKHY